MVEVTNSPPIIKFRDIYDWLTVRHPPITQEDIANKSRYFGAKTSQTSVGLFFRGKLSPRGTSFKSIRRTIEGWQECIIDFTDSPYHDDLVRWEYPLISDPVESMPEVA